MLVCSLGLALVGVLAVGADASGARPALRAASASRCAAIPSSATILRGAPSRSLLSILGVLRRPLGYKRGFVLAPALTSDFALEGPVYHRQVFTNYIRLVHDRSGAGYYLVPTLITPCMSAIKPYDGVAVFGPSGGGGAATAAQIEDGRSWGYGGTAASMLVPDGVATVTLRYRALSGSHRKAGTDFVVVATVAGNLIVTSWDKHSEFVSMTWRAADGRIVKTFTTP